MKNGIDIDFLKIDLKRHLLFENLEFLKDFNSKLLCIGKKILLETFKKDNKFRERYKILDAILKKKPLFMT